MHFNWVSKGPADDGAPIVDALTLAMVEALEKGKDLQPGSRAMLEYCGCGQRYIHPGHWFRITLEGGEQVEIRAGAAHLLAFHRSQLDESERRLVSRLPVAVPRYHKSVGEELIEALTKYEFVQPPRQLTPEEKVQEATDLFSAIQAAGDDAAIIEEDEVEDRLYYKAITLLEMIQRGDVTWTDLPFAEAELNREMKRHGVRAAVHAYEQLQTKGDSCYAKDVPLAMETYHIQWEDLPFSAADLDHELARVPIYRAEHLFREFCSSNDLDDMEEDCWSLRALRREIAEGTITWSDLSFTEDDIAREVKRLPVRKAMYWFQRVQQESSSCPNIRNSHAYWLRKLIQEGEVAWKDLPFTEDDLKQEENK